VKRVVKAQARLRYGIAKVERAGSVGKEGNEFKIVCCRDDETTGSRLRQPANGVCRFGYEMPDEPQVVASRLLPPSRRTALS
jgi:hypothetical protein